MLLASISTHLHISKDPANGQATSMSTIDKNPSAYINPNQPLMCKVTVTEQEILAQELKVKEARQKLAQAVKALGWISTQYLNCDENYYNPTYICVSVFIFKWNWIKFMKCARFFYSVSTFFLTIARNADSCVANSMYSGSTVVLLLTSVTNRSLSTVSGNCKCLRQ